MDDLNDYNSFLSVTVVTWRKVVGDGELMTGDKSHYLHSNNVTCAKPTRRPGVPYTFDK